MFGQYWIRSPTVKEGFTLIPIESRPKLGPLTQPFRLFHVLGPLEPWNCPAQRERCWLLASCSMLWWATRTTRSRNWKPKSLNFKAPEKMGPWGVSNFQTHISNWWLVSSEISWIPNTSRPLWGTDMDWYILSGIGRLKLTSSFVSNDGDMNLLPLQVQTEALQRILRQGWSHGVRLFMGAKLWLPNRLTQIDQHGNATISANVLFWKLSFPRISNVNRVNMPWQFRVTAIEGCTGVLHGRNGFNWDQRKHLFPSAASCDSDELRVEFQCFLRMPIHNIMIALYPRAGEPSRVSVLFSQRLHLNFSNLRGHLNGSITWVKDLSLIFESEQGLQKIRS